MKEDLSREDFRRRAEDLVCRVLRKTLALEFGTFKLSNGKITPYYVDLRVIPSFPDAFERISEIYINAIRRELGEDKFDRVSGIPLAGMAFAVVVAYRFHKPFIYVRQARRLRGRERRVEGVLMPGDRVLLIDDLVTTGLSLERAAKAIRAEGGIVTDAFVLLDREEGGEERLARNGVKLHPILRISDVARKLYDMNAIGDEELRVILSQTVKG